MFMYMSMYSHMLSMVSLGQRHSHVSLSGRLEALEPEAEVIPDGANRRLQYRLGTMTFAGLMGLLTRWGPDTPHPTQENGLDLDINFEEPGQLR